MSLRGYAVEKTDSDNIPYRLLGPRGARIGLCRNQVNRHMLFAVNLRTMNVEERLGWFSDESGGLVEVVVT